MPEGKIRDPNIALMTVLLPLDVLFNGPQVLVYGALNQKVLVN